MDFSINDLDMDLLRRAYRGWSFDPEKRADRDAAEYIEHMNNVYAAFLEKVTTEESRDYLEQAMIEYKAGYIAKMNAWAHAASRCISTMIAGPANFPVARAEKANRSEEKRSEEWMEWAKTARQRIERKLKDMRPAETKEAEHREQIRRAVLGRHMTANITGYIKRMAERGEVDDVEYALQVLRDEYESFATPRHSVWKQADVARAVAAKMAQREEQARSSEPTTYPFSGGVIIDNVLDNRVQIDFDDRPDEALRTALKREGWRWAPSVGKWQRQRTANALASAKRICNA